MVIKNANRPAGPGRLGPLVKTCGNKTPTLYAQIAPTAERQSTPPVRTEWFAVPPRALASAAPDSSRRARSWGGAVCPSRPRVPQRALVRQVRAGADGCAPSSTGPAGYPLRRETDRARARSTLAADMARHGAGEAAIGWIDRARLFELAEKYAARDAGERARPTLKRVREGW